MTQSLTHGQKGKFLAITRKRLETTKSICTPDAAIISNINMVELGVKKRPDANMRCNFEQFPERNSHKTTKKMKNSRGDSSYDYWIFNCSSEIILLAIAINFAINGTELYTANCKPRIVILISVLINLHRFFSTVQKIILRTVKS